MLSYAFKVLSEQGYKDMATEEFQNTQDLCAGILITGLKKQIKRGLGKDYVSQNEKLSLVRGKINVAESLKTNILTKRQLYCQYDEFCVDSPMNRILKATMLMLLHCDVAPARKKEMKKLLVFFSDVSVIEVESINWHLQYDRNNQTYHMLIAICFLSIRSLLQSKESGSNRMMDFSEEQMSRLYEKFILEYYRKEYAKIGLQANPSQISWQLDDDDDFMLPVMQTDITLQSGSRILIIDAKYYTHTTQVQFDVHTLHSNNLYQIFTYVKNKEGSITFSVGLDRAVNI
jgi:5-methylcytosine-specific restriction enzyme subunit McrC